MAVFLIDELAVFTGAVVAMRVTKVGEQRGRFLKLMGGTVMIAMAGTLLMAPEAMENVGGVIAVFGIGALMAGFAIALSRLGVGRPGSRTPTSRREPM
jgi:hypothetical protein